MKGGASVKTTGRNGSSGQGEGKTFCEFFAGIGLVREGLSASGWSCVYANDIDPKKRELYEGRFGSDGHFHQGDVRDLEEVIKKFPGTPFLATASFPCIDLSLAGHWRGFDGEHSSTFFGFAKALDALKDRKPKLVMLENVTGFVTSQGGKDFELAVRTLSELGYWIDAFVLDAKYFVPQSRPRVFVVGIHESLNTSIAFRKSRLDWVADEWIETIERAHKAIRPPKLVSLMRSIELPTGWAAIDVPSPKGRRPDIGELIDLDEAQAWWDDAAVAKHYDMMNDRHRKTVDEMLAAGKTFVGTIFRRKRDGKTRAEVRFDGMAGCLRTPKGGSAKQIVIALDEGKMRMRWMSAREYARLQGAEDFPLVANTIQNLYGFGDAVCVPVIRWIDKYVLTPIYESESRLQGKARGRQSDAGTAPPNHASGERQEYIA
jgi:DNA (cytosine-5)-methyltransferase 1